MIWIIGGTAETSQLLKLLNDRRQYVVTVATETGREMLPDDRVRVGRMNEKTMQRFAEENQIRQIVDMSHPYAVQVSQNACRVGQKLNIPYYRWLRDSTDIDTLHRFSSLEKCLEFLKQVEGCVFFTTGSKNIVDFQTVRKSNRFIYRVLPTVSSLEICKNNKVDLRDIVAVLGPLSEAMNMSMFREFKADYVVMKDSGKVGGTREKISACQKLHITPLLIDRKQEKGFKSLVELVDQL